MKTYTKNFGDGKAQIVVEWNAAETDRPSRRKVVREVCRVIESLVKVA